jgi:hypothetical protein
MDVIFFGFLFLRWNPESLACAGFFEKPIKRLAEGEATKVTTPATPTKIPAAKSLCPLTQLTILFGGTCSGGV